MSRSPGAGAPIDPGLQQERTSLAWRRTTTAFLVAGLVLARLALEESVPVAVLTLIASSAAGWLVVAAWRDRRWAPDPARVGFRLVRDGRLPAFASAVCAGLCVSVVVLVWR